MPIELKLVKIGQMYAFCSRCIYDGSYT